MSRHSKLTTPCMKQNCCDSENYNAQCKSQQRQIRHIQCDEEDENCALGCECKRVAHLRERCGLLGDGADYFSTTDRFQRTKLRVPHLSHEAQAQFVDDRLNLGGRRNQNVLLCLNKEKQRDDEKRR